MKVAPRGSVTTYDPVVKEPIAEPEDVDGGVRAAEEARRHLEEFVHCISHDLREPARTVEGFARLLSEDYAARLDDRAREYLAFLMQGAERLGSMIADLASLSRVESRGRPFEPVPLTSTLASARASLAEDLARTDAELTHGPLPPVRGDPSQLREVFEHLLDNAIKFRGDAPPRVHVAASAAGASWRVSVADHGVGLDPREADQCFIPFRRLCDPGVPGRGFGLAYCRRVVERHGGVIGLDGSPGQGCTVRFTLPRA